MTQVLASEREIFERCVAVTFDLEGGDKLSTDRADGGNWTGGTPGRGEFIGTRWGISAAAFPHVDIAHLDQARAAEIAYASYWVPVDCDLMPESLALLVFDAAFQHGPKSAIEMLQLALRVRSDGDFGRLTATALAAVLQMESAHDALRDLMAAFQEQRLLHMQRQPSWARDHVGLCRRLAVLMSRAISIADQAGSAAA